MACALQSSDEVGLLPTDLELLAGEEEEDKEGDIVGGTILEDQDAYQQAIMPEAPRPDSLPGVLLRTRTTQDTWLSAGVRDGVAFMVEGRDVYRPLTLDEGWNALYFEAPENLGQGSICGQKTVSSGPSNPPWSRQASVTGS